MPYALTLPPGLSISVPNAPWPFAYPYAMTIELWLKPSGPGAIFDSPSFGGDSSLTLNADGSLSAQRGGNGSWSTSPLYLFDGNWHHLAIATADGTNWSVYHNGSTVSVNGSGLCYLLGPLNGTDPTVLAFAGYVAEFRLWNVQRSQAQIQAGYGTQLSPPQAGLVGLWNFSGQNANDATGTFSTDSGGSGLCQSSDLPVFTGSTNTSVFARPAPAPARRGRNGTSDDSASAQSA